MSKGDQLIDSHVSLKQCQKAIEALHSHELKQKEKFEENQLLPGKEQHIWLNVTVKKIVARHRLKPYKIPISHPLVDPRTTPVCLITKDPQREYKDLLEKHNIKFISRVVGIEKLKGKFKPFEARRMLLKENGMFLADERVIPLLPKLLGTKWFEAKKQPIPVCLTRKDLKGELERAISSTYMNQNQGTCTSVKVGKMSQKPSQIVENVQTALPAIAKAIKGGWDNIQSFHIKTNASVSLPIWSCSLEDVEGGRWDGLKAGDGEDEDEDESDEDESSNSKKTTPSKGRKRPSSSDEEEEEEEKPKKKAKGADGALKTKEPAKPGSKIASARVDSTATPSKKRKAGEQPSTSSKPEVPAPSGKKGKLAAADSAPSKTSLQAKSVSEGGGTKDAAQATTQPEGASVETSSKKKKSGGKASDDTASPKKSAPSSGPASTATLSGEESGKSKEKKEKKQKEKKSTKVVDAVMASVTEKPAATSGVSLSKEGVKQKRSAGAGEKKKEIIAKSKGGKSVKNAVLGKKAAQV